MLKFVYDKRDFGLDKKDWSGYGNGKKGWRGHDYDKKDWSGYGNGKKGWRGHDYDKKDWSFRFPNLV
jgi:hypothetical protein